MPVCTPKWGTWGTWFEIGVQSGVHRLMYDDVIIFGFTFGFSFSFCFVLRVSATCLILSPACSLKLALGSNPRRAFHFLIGVYGIVEKEYEIYKHNLLQHIRYIRYNRHIA